MADPLFSRWEYDWESTQFTVEDRVVFDLCGRQGVYVAKWAKRPPLNQEDQGSNPPGWFIGRAGNRDPFRWLETARGLELIRLIGRAQYSRGTGRFLVIKGALMYPFAVSAMK